ncbi:hypothetical protein CYMTET_23137 [Cymbomonas tetramitiformis]|uniref:Uncharacterized protein n=1 Tax=Cymbomonas tetramitiformis TaxID=36881 RepID=A0AAE0L1K9_9CHLO|nr:hypothetical protein CYMTET_23137 [Cymbomonas tetramitiformis]
MGLGVSWVRAPELSCCEGFKTRYMGLGVSWGIQATERSMKSLEDAQAKMTLLWNKYVAESEQQKMPKLMRTSSIRRRKLHQDRSKKLKEVHTVSATH